MPRRGEPSGSGSSRPDSSRAWARYNLRNRDSAAAPAPDEVANSQPVDATPRTRRASARATGRTPSNQRKSSANTRRAAVESPSEVGSKDISSPYTTPSITRRLRSASNASPAISGVQIDDVQSVRRRLRSGSNATPARAAAQTDDIPSERRLHYASSSKPDDVRATQILRTPHAAASSKDESDASDIPNTRRLRSSSRAPLNPGYYDDNSLATHRPRPSSGVSAKATLRVDDEHNSDHLLFARKGTSSVAASQKDGVQPPPVSKDGVQQPPVSARRKPRPHSAVGLSTGPASTTRSSRVSQEVRGQVAKRTNQRVHKENSSLQRPLSSSSALEILDGNVGCLESTEQGSTPMIDSESEFKMTDVEKTFENIHQWRKADLVLECKRRGLRILGVKRDLKARILADNSHEPKSSHVEAKVREHTEMPPNSVGSVAKGVKTRSQLQIEGQVPATQDVGSNDEEINSLDHGDDINRWDESGMTRAPEEDSEKKGDTKGMNVSIPDESRDAEKLHFATGKPGDETRDGTLDEEDNIVNNFHDTADSNSMEVDAPNDEEDGKMRTQGVLHIVDKSRPGPLEAAGGRCANAVFDAPKEFSNSNVWEGRRVEKEREVEEYSTEENLGLTISENIAPAPIAVGQSKASKRSFGAAFAADGRGDGNERPKVEGYGPTGPIPEHTAEILSQGGRAGPRDIEITQDQAMAFSSADPEELEVDAGCSGLSRGAVQDAGYETKVNTNCEEEIPGPTAALISKEGNIGNRENSGSGSELARYGPHIQVLLESPFQSFEQKTTVGQRNPKIGKNDLIQPIEETEERSPRKNNDRDLEPTREVLQEVEKKHGDDVFQPDTFAGVIPSTRSGEGKQMAPSLDTARQSSAQAPLAAAMPSGHLDNFHKDSEEIVPVVKTGLQGKNDQVANDLSFDETGTIDPDGDAGQELCDSRSILPWKTVAVGMMGADTGEAAPNSKYPVESRGSVDRIGQASECNHFRPALPESESRNCEVPHERRRGDEVEKTDRNDSKMESPYRADRSPLHEAPVLTTDNFVGDVAVGKTDSSPDLDAVGNVLTFREAPDELAESGAGCPVDHGQVSGSITDKAPPMFAAAGDRRAGRSSSPSEDNLNVNSADNGEGVESKVASILRKAVNCSLKDLEDTFSESPLPSPRSYDPHRNILRDAEMGVSLQKAGIFAPESQPETGISNESGSGDEEVHVEKADALETPKEADASEKLNRAESSTGTGVNASEEPAVPASIERDVTVGHFSETPRRETWHLNGQGAQLQTLASCDGTEVNEPRHIAEEHPEPKTGASDKLFTDIATAQENVIADLEEDNPQIMQVHGSASTDEASSSNHSEESAAVNGEESDGNGDFIDDVVVGSGSSSKEGEDEQSGDSSSSQGADVEIADSDQLSPGGVFSSDGENYPSPRSGAFNDQDKDEDTGGSRAIPPAFDWRDAPQSADNEVMSISSDDETKSVRGSPGSGGIGKVGVRAEIAKDETQVCDRSSKHLKDINAMGNIQKEGFTPGTALSLNVVVNSTKISGAAQIVPEVSTQRKLNVEGEKGLNVAHVVGNEQPLEEKEASQPAQAKFSTKDVAVAIERREEALPTLQTGNLPTFSIASKDVSKCFGKNLGRETVEDGHGRQAGLPGKSSIDLRTKTSSQVRLPLDCPGAQPSPLRPTETLFRSLPRVASKTQHVLPHRTAKLSARADQNTVVAHASEKLNSWKEQPQQTGRPPQPLERQCDSQSKRSPKRKMWNQGHSLVLGDGAKRLRTSSVLVPIRKMPSPATALSSLKPVLATFANHEQPQNAAVSRSLDFGTANACASTPLLERLSRIEQKETSVLYPTFRDRIGLGVEQDTHSSSSTKESQDLFHTGAVSSKRTILSRPRMQAHAKLRVLQARRPWDSRELAAQSLQRTMEMAQKVSAWQTAPSPFKGINNAPRREKYPREEDDDVGNDHGMGRDDGRRSKRRRR